MNTCSNLCRFNKLTSSHNPIQLNTRADAVAGAGLTAEEVLKNHKTLDYTAEKKFPNGVLGYVTPVGHKFDD